MKIRRVFSAILVYLLFSVSISIPANAAEVNCNTRAVSVQETVMPRVTESFSMSIPGKTRLSSENIMSLTKGESVTIKASYIPFNVSVDIGIVDSDGVFYYINTTNGSFNETISISKTDQYMMQIRNNSAEVIEVSGHVSY